MFNTALVIGKFYPPHRGHSYLINRASSQARNLAIIVCGKPDQYPPAELRASWLSELHPQARVLVIADTLPEDDSKAWAEQTISWLGYVPNAVFTSEDYGDPYAYYLGCTHIRVDKARQVVPCSGTAIRANPLAHWEFLAPCVRSYYVKRICVLGAESTGTTTLAQALATHYQTIWVPEYGRHYSETKFSTAEATNWRTEEFEHIATEQCRREDEAARQANRVLICDTDAFATGIWHQRYMGTPSPEVETIAQKRHYDLYLLTDVNIPFIQDGTRDGEHLRHWMHELFASKLQQQGKKSAVVTGSPAERLKTATALIDELF